MIVFVVIIVCGEALYFKRCMVWYCFDLFFNSFIKFIRIKNKSLGKEHGNCTFTYLFAFSCLSFTTNRDFIGMRDFYCLLKYLRENCANTVHLNEDILISALCRNFGGRPESMQHLLEVFCKSCFIEDKVDFLVPPTVTLITDNLKSITARHLMVLTAHENCLSLLLGTGCIAKEATVLIGSNFKDDLQELHLIQQINQVKNCMARGETCILLNNEHMFESLYDVLNQRLFATRFLTFVC